MIVYGYAIIHNIGVFRFQLSVYIKIVKGHIYRMAFVVSTRNASKKDESNVYHST